MNGFVKKYIFISFTSIVPAFLLSAQNKKEDIKLQQLFKGEFGSHGAGLAYEFPIKEKWTLDVSSGIGMGYAIRPPNKMTAAWDFKGKPSFFIKSGVKYLYNREKRLKEQRPVLNNAGNYLAFQIKFTSPKIAHVKKPLHYTLLNEVYWGMQRSLSGGHWLLNLHLGIGYAIDIETGVKVFYPAPGLKLSFIIFTKRKR